MELSTSIIFHPKNRFKKKKLKERRVQFHSVCSSVCRGDGDVLNFRCVGMNKWWIDIWGERQHSSRLVPGSPRHTLDRVQECLHTGDSAGGQPAKCLGRPSDVVKSWGFFYASRFLACLVGCVINQWFTGVWAAGLDHWSQNVISFRRINSQRFIGRCTHP